MLRLFYMRLHQLTLFKSPLCNFNKKLNAVICLQFVCVLCYLFVLSSRFTTSFVWLENEIYVPCFYFAKRVSEGCLLYSLSLFVYSFPSYKCCHCVYKRSKNLHVLYCFALHCFVSMSSRLPQSVHRAYASPPSPSPSLSMFEYLSLF